MSTAHQLTEQQRQQLLTGHYSLSDREMVRYWLLSKDDLKGINEGFIANYVFADLIR